MNDKLSKPEVIREVNKRVLAPHSHQKRICIVTGELAGPFYNGGIGTTNRALAIELSKMGYHVDILYTHVSDGNPLCLKGEFTDHVETFRRHNIRLICIENRKKWYDWLERSYLSPYPSAQRKI